MRIWPPRNSDDDNQKLKGRRARLGLEGRPTAVFKRGIPGAEEELRDSLSFMNSRTNL